MRVSLVVAYALVLAAAADSFAQTSWIGGTNDDDFATAANWSNGLPSGGNTATIDNGVAKLATNDTFIFGELRVNDGGASAGTLEVSDGSLGSANIRIGLDGAGSTVDLSGGFVRSNDDVFIGGNGTGNTGEGTLNQSGGFIDSFDDFQLGRDGTGTFNFTGGVARGVFTVVGKFGTGVWEQSGGVYVQTGGEFEIGDGGTPGQGSTPGPRTGTVNLSGGVIQVNESFAIGNRVGSGTVNIRGGGLAITGGNALDLFVGRGMDHSIAGSGGPTELRITGGEAVIAVGRNFLMNTRGVASSSTLVAEITGLDHTTIQVRGNADIGNGSLKVELNDFTPSSGDSWTLLQTGADLTDALAEIDTLVANGGFTDLNGNGNDGDTLSHNSAGTPGTRTGEFMSVDTSLAPLPSGLSWEVDYSDPLAVVLNVVGVPGIPGDYNNDDLVNAADYSVFRDTIGDGNGRTFEEFAANFGAGETPGVVANATAVPEPAAAVTVALGLVLGSTRRRRA